MKKVFLFLVAFFFANTANATIYKLDPNHTNITWSANHFGFSNPSGKFTESTGVIIVDEANPRNSSVAIAIKTKSVQTGISAFDDRLKGPDFFDINKYPEATFVSKNIIVQGKSAKIIGDFTLLGTTQSVTLNARLNRVGLNTYTQKKTIGFSATAVIKRSDFGMDFGTPGISDNVKIAIEVEGIVDPSAKDTLPANTSNNSDNDSLFSNNAWKISPESSSINFIANSNGNSINGSFKTFSGRVEIDPKNLSGEGALSLDIDVSSISASISDALPVLKSSDWLDFAQFPKATFVATQFTKTNTNQVIAKGKLTLKGRTAPVDATFYVSSYTDSSARVIGSAVIKRSDFGIGNKDINKANGVKDEIQIKFAIEAKK